MLPVRPIEPSTRTMSERELLKRFGKLVAVGAVATAAISFALFVWGTWFLPPKEDFLTDQSLANYIGIIFATAVALAGSFVAIQLAARAVDAAKKQVDLTELSNAIAERQSTESMLAIESTAKYQQFKSMLITLPALLRRGHRDKLFDHSGFNVDLLKNLLDILGTSIAALVSSNVPASVVEIARKLEEKDPTFTPEIAAMGYRGQRHIEYAISSLQYDLSMMRVSLNAAAAGTSSSQLRLQLLRILNAIYALVRAIDATLMYAENVKGRKASAFSILEDKFIEHVAPVANLNKGPSLVDDFAGFADDILSSNELSMHRHRAALTPDAFQGSPGNGGVLLALHDSGFAEGLFQIQSCLETMGKKSFVVRVGGATWMTEALKKAKLVRSILGQGEGVEPADVDDLIDPPTVIFFITEAPMQRLHEVSDFVKQHPRHVGKKYVVLIDQAEQPSTDRRSNQYLTVGDAIPLWTCFSLVHQFLEDGRNWADTPVPAPEEPDDAEPEEESMDNSAGFQEDWFVPLTPGQLHAMCNEIRRIEPDLPYTEFFNDGKKASRTREVIGAAIDRVDLIEDAAAQTDDAAVVTREDYIAHTHLLCGRVLNLIYKRVDDDALFIPYKPTEELVEKFDSACFEIIAELAKPPFLSNPVSGMAEGPSGYDNGMSPVSVELDNATIFGVAYLDSYFKLPSSPLLTLLSSRPSYRLF